MENTFLCGFYETLVNLHLLFEGQYLVKKKINTDENGGLVLIDTLNGVQWALLVNPHCEARNFGLFYSSRGQPLALGYM